MKNIILSIKITQGDRTMNLPKDKVMLLSVINTALRDKYNSLDELCESEGIDKEQLIKNLAEIDYIYKEEVNQFK